MLYFEYRLNVHILQSLNSELAEFIHPITLQENMYFIPNQIHLFQSPLESDSYKQFNI